MNANTVVAVLLSLSLTACSQEDGVKGYDAFERHVAKNRIGKDADQWVEMKNSFGEWERTALVFGYLGDHDECLKMIAGLKKENFAREYQCVPAN